MRSLHRWIMTVFVLLLAYWAVSGLIMAIYDVQDRGQSWAREGGGAGARPVSVLRHEDVEPMLDVVTKAAASASHGAPITALVLRVVDGTPLGIVGTGGPTPQQLILNARSGEVISAQPAEPPDAPGGAGSVFMGTYLPSLHNRIKDWHRGNALGDTGIWLALATGGALLCLSVTGLWLYCQMLFNRRRSGRRDIFWH